MSLGHPADTTVERFENGDADAATELIDGRDRAELKYILNQLLGEAFDMDADAVYTGDGSFTREEVAAMVESLGEEVAAASGAE